MVQHVDQVVPDLLVHRAARREAAHLVVHQVHQGAPQVVAVSRVVAVEQRVAGAMRRAHLVGPVVDPHGVESQSGQSARSLTICRPHPLVGFGFPVAMARLFASHAVQV